MVPVVSATLTTRTVRECAHLIGAGWHTTEWRPACSTAGVTHQARERLVVDPVFVPLPEAPDLTCRECGGDGRMVDWTTEQPCDACGGTGVSPVYAATWQTVDMPLDPFEPFGPMVYEHSDGRREPIPPPAPTVNDLFVARRQVVEWRATDVTPMPVVDDSVRTAIPDTTHIVAHRTGEVSLWTSAGPRSWHSSVLDEPWAADLRPGQLVLRLSGWEHLEQPHTEMACPMPDEAEDNPTTLDNGVCGTCNGSTRVPLSVPDGVLSWIELA